MSLWNQFVEVLQALNGRINILEDGTCCFQEVCYGTPENPVFSIPHGMSWGAITQMMGEFNHRLHMVMDILMRLIHINERFVHEMNYTSPQLDEKIQYLQNIRQVIQSLMSCLNVQNNPMPADLLSLKQLVDNIPGN